MFALSLFVCLLCLVSGQLTPAYFQTKAAQGFSTNWFKTDEPLSKYQDRNIQDVYDRGFRNLRLRCRADLYDAPYVSDKFRSFLEALEKVVDKCIEVGVVPIISWIHQDAEAYATDQDRKNYIQWWTLVAEKLKFKSYDLAFNLFTELGIDGCGSHCEGSLRKNTTKYNQWTSEVVQAIRGTGGKNDKRILILGSPGKTAKDLEKIDKNIYKDDLYMMAEWHIYASGPNKNKGSQKYWEGDGKPPSKENVKKAIAYATSFTADTNVLTYLGAWMPQDNSGGSLREAEVRSFARYFTKELGKAGVPWSLNVLDRYYDTANGRWIKEKQDIKGQLLDMNKVLNNILAVME